MHNLLPWWNNHYDLYILGVNYFGDWTPAVAQYKIWPAANRDDIYGISKVVGFASQVKPDIIFVLNDPWILTEYAKALKKYKEVNPNVKIFAYTPVDAPNINKKFITPLNDVFDTIITYTEFGRNELLFSGLETKHEVIPHGVDITTYKPIPKLEAKAKLGIPLDNFVILTNNRNQPRKALDTTVYYISEWIKRYNIPMTCRWYYHGALMDEGWDILNLVDWYGIKNRLIVSATDLSAANTLPPEHMQIMNSSADLFFTTTKAEGWGLTASEAMACKTATLLPYHSAFAEWANGATHFMKADLPTHATNTLNTVHYTTDKESAIEGLHKMYVDGEYRDKIALAGYTKMNQPEYRWQTIAKRFMDIFQQI